jgi:hypothetical protein
MTTKLQVYNNALLLLGERKLASLTENRKPRRVLDQLWDSDFVKGCLEAGLWNFATRTIQSEYSPSITPGFGYRYAHDKPTDWVRTSALSISEYFTDPLMAYQDESAYWFTDQETLFIRYVSDDAAYGSDLSIWPESFSSYVEAELAARAAKSFTQSDQETLRLEDKAVRALRSAKAKDAMNDSARYTPTGSWVRARGGGRRGNPPTNIRTL